jgi:hypothetical protein
MTYDVLDALASRYEKPRAHIDSVAWARETLRVHLWSRQRQILRMLDICPKLAVRSAHDQGKSFIAAVATARFLSRYPLGTARVVSTAPSVDQVKAVLWNEINQLHERAVDDEGQKLLPGRVTQTEWWIGNYQAGVGRKPADYAPGTFQGLHAQHILIIVDEAGAIPNELWTGIDTLSTNEGAKILAIGNPDDPQSHFKSICEGAPENGWATIKISAWDSPNFTGEPVPQVLKEALLSTTWVEDKRIAWGEDDPRWQSKVEAEFPIESGMTIARLADVQTAQLGEELVRKMWPVAVQLGVDVAASDEGDETVVRERRGNKITRRWSVQSGEPEAITELVVQAARESGATLIHLDATGVGFGFIGDLRKQLPGVSIQPFVAAASAEDTKQFVNRRAEAHWYLRDSLRRREIDLSQLDDPGDKAVTEMLAVRYKIQKGKVLVEPKTDIRKRLGRSPDDADALILALLPPSGTGMPAPATARAPQSIRHSASVPQTVPVNTTPRAVPEQIIYPGQSVPLRRIRSIRARV